MAKKTPGKGKKLCPTCGSALPAAARSCACGHEFGDRQRRGRRKQPRDLAGQIKVVNEMGGVAAARRILTSIKENLAKFDALGGVDAAEATIDLIEQFGISVIMK